jgi:RNA polymerase sigma-70 factor (ECF subfamily)
VIGEVVRRVIGKYGFTRQDRADLEQELLLNALVRLPKFDPELSTMPMFVRGVTINRLRNIIAARRAAFRGLPSGGSLNEMAEDEEGWFAERIDGISEDQYLRATGRASRPSHELRELHLDLQRAIESLPPDLQELCLRLLTHRVTEIARECGVSTATIYHRLKKIRREFAALGLEEYLR